jgi:flagellar protein FliO/FliZ
MVIVMKNRILLALSGLFLLTGRVFADAIPSEVPAEPVALASATLRQGNLGVSGAEVSTTLLTLMTIVGLLFLGSYLLKRFRVVSGPANHGVSVVGQIPMSVKEKLLIIQVGDEKILVGSAAGNMRTLHRWASPEEEPLPSAESPVFARLLRAKTAAPARGKEASV